MGYFVAAIIGLVLAVFAIWIIGVVIVKAAAYLVYIAPPIFTLAVLGAAVFAVAVAVWVLIGGGRPKSVVLTPQMVLDGPVFRASPRGPSKEFGWDRAWPSYLPFQLGRDVHAIFATQISLLTEYWKKLWAYVGKHGILAHAAAALFVYLPFGAFTVAVFIDTVLMLAALSVVFGIAMLVRWGIIFGLRGMDAGLRRLRRSSARCPHPACYRPTTLPSFACPNPDCSIVHRDLRPGRLGTMFRRCECGSVLPTTVLRAAVARLTPICPFCDRKFIEGAGTRQTLQIPVFGPVASGKTRFLMASVVSLGEKIRSQGGQLIGMDQTSISQLELATDLIVQRANTVKTAVELPQAFGLLARPADGKRSVEIHLFDAAGELFDNWDESANLRYLESADGFVFLIDPLTTPAARASLDRMAGSRDAIAIGSGSPVDSYDTTIEQLRAAGSDLKKKSLAVVLPKADVLLTLPVAGALRAGDEKSIREWLSDNELDSLIDRIRLDFKSVKYFVADSLDSIAPDAALSPFHPIGWLIKEAKAAVIRAEVDLPTPNVSESTPEPVGASAGRAAEVADLDEFDWTQR